MRDYDGFVASLLNAPGDSTIMGAFADWLDEHDKHHLAFALRWAARRRLFPDISPMGRRSNWSTHRRGQYKPAYPHQLPPLVFAQLRPLGRVRTSTYAPPRFTSGSLMGAFAALADALRRLRDVLE